MLYIVKCNSILRRKILENQLHEAGADSRRYLAMAKEQALQAWPAAARQPIASAGVIGAGTMGTGIAIALSRAGIATTLVDSDQQALDRARERIETDTANAVTKRRMAPTDAAAALDRLDYRRSIADLPAIDLAIEAAFERLTVKQAIMRELDAHCPPSTILGTNTSTLDLDRIADATRRPHSVVGLHFFSPAHVMPLIEIVRGANTDAAMIASAVDLAERLGKTGIVVGNCYGFAGNRMVEGLGREVNRLLLEGNEPAAIDAALRDFGMAMGPLEVADLVGIDVPYQARQENSQAMPGDRAYYRMADALVERAWFGQKSGRGYYRYTPGVRGGQPDPEVMDIASAEAARLGIARHIATPADIVDRCILPIINEGARILDEGIASRASDLDLIYTLGYGFPAALGGPMHYADTLGLVDVLARLRKWHATFGDYWRPAALIERLAATNGSFATRDRESAIGQP